MSFDAPVWLLALLLVPVFVALYVAAQRRRSRYTVRFTNLDLLANVAGNRPAWRRHVPPALFLAALALLGMAVARPQADVQVPKEEATVVLVLDVSGSMNAVDVEPSRIAAAQDAANAFLDKLPDGFRVGIVTFAEAARVVLPPTADRDQAREAISDLYTAGGTAMGEGIALALQTIRDPEAFGAEPVPSQTPSDGVGAGGDEEPIPAVMLLLSDGFNTLGSTEPMDAAQVAADTSVPIFTVALGTDDGFVDVFDQAGRLRRVEVPPDRETLSAIAELTGGEYFEATSDDQLTRVYEGLSSKIGFDTEKREVTWAFAGIAALLLMAGAGLSLHWFNRFP